MRVTVLRIWMVVYFTVAKRVFFTPPWMVAPNMLEGHELIEAQNSKDSIEAYRYMSYAVDCTLDCFVTAEKHIACSEF